MPVYKYVYVLVVVSSVKGGNKNLQFGIRKARGS